MKHYYETFLPEHLNAVLFFNMKLAHENTLLRLIPHIKLLITVGQPHWIIFNLSEFNFTEQVVSSEKKVEIRPLIVKFPMLQPKYCSRAVMVGFVHFKFIGSFK